MFLIHYFQHCEPYSGPNRFLLNTPLQSDFSTALRDSSARLTTFVFTRLARLPKYSFREADMIKIAAQIACDNASLRQFSLRCGLAPQSFLDSIEFREVGVYIVMSDKYGTPDRLSVHHRGRSFNSHYIYRLKSRGVKGVLFQK